MSAKYNYFIDVSFPISLKQMRHDRGLTQAELARQIGVNRVTVWQYENSKTRPSLEKVVNLCQVFNCSVEKLLGIPKVK